MKALIRQCCVCKRVWRHERWMTCLFPESLPMDSVTHTYCDVCNKEVWKELAKNASTVIKDASKAVKEEEKTMKRLIFPMIVMLSLCSFVYGQTPEQHIAKKKAAIVKKQAEDKKVKDEAKKNGNLFVSGLFLDDLKRLSEAQAAVEKAKSGSLDAQDSSRKALETVVADMNGRVYKVKFPIMTVRRDKEDRYELTGNIDEEVIKSVNTLVYLFTKDEAVKRLVPKKDVYETDAVLVVTDSTLSFYQPELLKKPEEKK